MIEYDELEQRMVLKIVYYGPAMSGKTTNLLRLHDLISREGRGELMVLDTKDDRTIYFDLLPFFLVAPDGLKVKVKVYTVPGQICHDATRKAVLARADGVAFIADSQLSEASNNAESFENLEKNIAFVGLDIERLPLVIQFNKRDMKDIVTEHQIRDTWSNTGIPVFMASALDGWGVVETFRSLVGRVYDAINGRYQLADSHQLTREMFMNSMIKVTDGQA